MRACEGERRVKKRGNDNRPLVRSFCVIGCLVASKSDKENKRLFTTMSAGVLAEK